MLGLTDTSGRLARWRLRLSEFDYSVDYKKGIKNTLADALSRLATDGETTVGPDLDIPVLPVDNCCDSVCAHCFDLDIYDDEDRLDHLTAQYKCSDVLHTEPVSALTLEEILEEQRKDAYVQHITKLIEQNEIKIYKINEQGVLVRIYPIDLVEQIFLPKPLRERVLYLAHHTTVAGHPGGTRMYSTLRRTYYWPNLAVDCYNTVRNCVECAKQRIQLRKHTSFLKLFPARRPGEYVSIDILGPLPQTPRKNIYILVITDRYSKMTKVQPLTNIKALTVAKAFCDEWVFHYGQPTYLLSDRGTQFVSDLFGSVCKILNIKQAFTAAYHPQTCLLYTSPSPRDA